MLKDVLHGCDVFGPYRNADNSRTFNVYGNTPAQVRQAALILTEDWHMRGWQCDKSAAISQPRGNWGMRVTFTKGKRA